MTHSVVLNVNVKTYLLQRTDNCTNNTSENTELWRYINQSTVLYCKLKACSWYGTFSQRVVIGKRSKAEGQRSTSLSACAIWTYKP